MTGETRAPGSFDAIEGDRLAGWAWDPAAPGRTVTVEIEIDGAVALACPADQFRADLLAAGIGDGCHAFVARVPRRFRDGAAHRLAARIQGGPALPGGPHPYRQAGMAVDEPGVSPIVNGSFRRWSRGPVFEAPEPGEETADGWTVHPSPAGDPGITVFAEHRTLPGMGTDAKLHGLGLRSVARARVALCAAIAPLDAAGDLALSFATAAAVPPRLSVWIGSAETRLHRIADGLALGCAPRRHAFRIPAETAFSLAAALRGPAAPGLWFACDGPAELGLFDVCIGPWRPAELAPARGFEDANLREHLDALPSLARWRDPRPMRPVPEPVPPQAAAASWTPPQAGAPRIEIVVCVHNALRDTLDCLDALLRHTTLPHTLTIVDDASDRRCARALDSFAAAWPWVRVLRNAENLGYTRTANRGLAESAADWIVLLNSDAVVTPDWLERMLEAGADPAVGLVGPMSNAASWQSLPEIAGRGDWPANRLPAGMSAADMAALVARASARAFPAVPLLNGFCLMVARRTLDAIGLFDEATFGAGFGEENDYCLRAAASGLRAVVADHAFVLHGKSRSYGHERRRALAKAADAKLRAKHPGVSLDALVAAMREQPDLAALRARVRAALAERAAPLREAAQ